MTGMQDMKTEVQYYINWFKTKKPQQFSKTIGAYFIIDKYKTRIEFVLDS